MVLYTQSRCVASSRRRVILHDTKCLAIVYADFHREKWASFWLMFEEKVAGRLFRFADAIVEYRCWLQFFELLTTWVAAFGMSAMCWRSRKPFILLKTNKGLMRDVYILYGSSFYKVTYSYAGRCTTTGFSAIIHTCFRRF